jgi:protein farnesyltransferase subunit beta
MKLEGGFQGRTNKLVDACYSFWQGGAAAIIRLIELELLGETHVECKASEPLVLKIEAIEIGPSIVEPTDQSGDQIFNQYALQKYILHCAQQVDGGLRDKPGKGRDFYHSCYALSGLSVSQHPIDSRGALQVYGDLDNLIAPTDPVYNIGPEKVKFAKSYFQVLPCDHTNLIRSYQMA